MSKRFATTLFVLLLAAAGCSGVNPAVNVSGGTSSPEPTPTSQAGLNQAIPNPSSSPAPEKTTVYHLTSYCALLNSRDIASLFSSAEVMKPVHQVSRVNHTVFSTENVSATESSCINYAFHRPGSNEGEMLQVTYWVDVPEHATASAWAQLWTDAKSKAAQAISDIGEDAFYENGRLTFKEGNVYVTLEAVGTYLNTSTQAGVTQQMEIEKQLARDASNRAIAS